MFSEEDDAVAARILDVLQDFVSQYVVYRFEPDAKQLIMGRLHDFEFGMSSLETFPIRILKMLAPGWLIGEIVDLTPFENRVRKVVRDWHVKKTAELAAQKTDESVHFSDDLH
jgi:hypothetical protein